MVGHQRFDTERFALFFANAISASVSAEKRLIETTTGRPNSSRFPRAAEGWPCPLQAP
jgi:hypothetical protein